MNRRQFFGVASLSGLTAGAGLAQRLADLKPDPNLTTGFAERDITPEIGMERPGNYYKIYHQRFFDPCKVRAAVFGEGGKRVALAGVDALMVPRGLVRAARQAIERRCGIAPGAVMISASHSHSSGPVGMIQPGEYDHASEFVQKLAYEYSSAADAGYLELVEKQIVAAVCQADAAREPAVCGFGSGREDHVAFNRRFRMKNGLTYTHPRQGNPNIAEVAGPIDPEVGVVGAWDKSGRLLGCIVNFACHGTASPNGISANWIFYMERVIRGAFGPGVIVVFLPGANGDVTQVDNLSPYERPGGAEASRFVGGRVGAEAVKTLLSMHPGAFSPLAHRAKVLNIPRRRPSPERVKQSYEIARRDPKQADRTEWAFAKEIVLLDALLKTEAVAEVEIQAIQIGSAVFLSNPAEYFVQYGLDIKAGSPFPLTFPVELANGCVGYVPTEEAFGPRGGGYETRLTSYSNLGISAGRRMADTAIELARAMSPGKMPQPPEHSAFSGPWSYGAVPPELK